MTGYIKKQLTKHKHPKPTRPQHSPFPYAPKTYGKASQDPSTPDKSPPARQEGITRVQKVVGSILYYARSIDRTPLVRLNKLASKQAQVTKKTITNMNHMLDY